jgi:chromosome partitioning protein
MPTTLSLCAYEQMLTFLTESRYAPEKVYAFFSMVDGCKKMHRETGLHIQNSLERILGSAIPYLSEIEQMGLTREPVGTLTHRSAAARAYQDLWDEVLFTVLGEKSPL